MKKHIFIIFFVILVLIFANVWASYSFLETTYFEYKSPKLQKEVKVVVLADLHNHEFGSSNANLISRVEEVDPDIILILGDMLNGTSKNSAVAVDLTEQLSSLAPVYYALGNHEIDYMERNGHQLWSEIEAAGAKILELDSQDIEVNGQKLRIGGMYDYAFASDDNASTIPENMTPEIYDFLTSFENTDTLKIMLSHRPDSFIFGEAPKTWNIDLVLSAHDHGGQVIFFGMGGLWGGDQGWFPKYVYGLHSLEKYDILITRGLGSHTQILPRFNNRPEVMVLKLMPEK